MGGVIVREELVDASLDLGGTPIDLTDYATTGLRVVAIGPSGSGKSNAAMLICEQLAEQGWIVVIVDPESELSELYGAPVESPEDLAEKLHARTHPFLVVSAPDAEAFVPYGEVVFDVCDKDRKPVVLMVDEGQLYSAPRAGRGRGALSEATVLLNEAVTRGRKRRLDVVITAHRYTSSVSRVLFGNMNLTLVGQQSDASAWTALAPLFRAHRLGYGDLAEMSTGEFYCLSRRGLDKFRLPLAAAMKRVAIKGRPAKKVLPTNFAQWDRAMSAMKTSRLDALTDEITEFLAGLAGLTPAQIAAGRAALDDERGARA